MAFLFLIAINAVGQERNMTIFDVIKNDKWVVAEGMHSGLPLILRYRNLLNKKPDISQYPNLIMIAWSYQSVGPGMPDHVAFFCVKPPG